MHRCKVAHALMRAVSRLVSTSAERNRAKPIRLPSATILLTAVLAATGAAQSPLLDAVQNSAPDRVAALLQQGADANSADSYGSTALHWAVELDDPEITDLLLKAGAKPSAVNRYGSAPLSLAATNGNAAVIGMLLTAGADPNTTAPGGETVLMTASRTGRVEAVRALIEAGADVDRREDARGQTALMWAAAEGHAAVIQALLAAGADIHARSGKPADNAPPAARREPVEQPVGDYFTRANGGPLNTLLELDSMSPLMFAVRDGRSQAVRTLLELGADVNETSSTGLSVLTLAIINAHYGLAQFLLEQGADPNASGQGWTPLHQVVSTPRLNYGRFPHPARTGDVSPLELAQSLLDRGADIDARMTVPTLGDGYRTRFNRLGATPLVLAAKGAYPEMIELLLNNGADPEARTAEGSTSLMLAAGVALFNEGDDAGTEVETLASVQLLVEHGAAVNQVDEHGETALHGAAYRGHNSTVRYLVEQGAKLDAKNIMGWTPLTIADGVHYTMILNRRPETATLLRELMRAQGMEVEEAQIVNEEFTGP